MAKNLMNRLRFDSGGFMQKLPETHHRAQARQDAAAFPPWIAKFAGKLMESNAGVFFASPIVRGHTPENKALEEYGRNITLLHGALKSENIVHVVSPPERELAENILLPPACLCIYMFHGRMDAAALARRDGKEVNGVRYSPGIVRDMRKFVNRSSSFLITGTYPAVKTVCDALYAYLLNMGLHKQKRIELDSKFTYRR